MNILQLLARYKEAVAYEQSRGEGTVISVDEIAAKVASFYEKIRGIVDWREEHLLRFTAIERILKRRMILQKDPDELAESLVHELIRGGHFPNNQIPLFKIDEAREIVRKYAFLLDHAEETLKTKEREEFQRWIFSVAASEIEEALDPPLRQRALIEYVAGEMTSRISLQDEKIAEQEKRLQIFIAVHRALFSIDDATISQRLLTEFFPQWKQLSPESFPEIASQMPRVKQQIDSLLLNHSGERFYRLIEQNDTPYLLLHDVISRDPAAFEAALADPSVLEDKVEEAYQTRLVRLKSRMRRAGIYSTLSILITKVALALGVEIPLDRFLYGDVHTTAMVLSVLVPSFLMGSLVLSVRFSTHENFQKVLLEFMRIVRGHEKKNGYYLSLPHRKRRSMNKTLRTLYLLSFFLTFGGLSYLLYYLGFTPFSTFVFLMFIALISFAGTRIRQRSRELLMDDDPQSFLGGLLDFFLLPLIHTGKWMSGKIARYNVLIMIFTFLIEAPLQLFVEFLEQWRAFLREKRGQIH